MPNLNSITVEIGNRSYPIYIGAETNANLGEVSRNHRVTERVVIITDRNVSRHYLRRISGIFSKAGYRVHSVIVPPGERQKNLSRVSRIATEMLDQRVPRSSAVVALGGGVIGDLAGFVAATYQRGVQLIHLPTSLLAQVDSSIGGKVGVNHPMGKNMIGAFYQPLFVWTDPAFLETLPRREIICGLGEIVKYAIIRDPWLFEYLEQNLDSIRVLRRKETLEILQRCISIKADIVARDEHEQHVRMILNCGHTIGHALEQAGDFKMLKHGEAVLHGLLAESFLAHALGILSDSELRRIADLIARIPIPRDLSSLRQSAILQAVSRDKKSHGDKVRFVLPAGIGETKVVDAVDQAILKQSIAQVLRKGSARTS